ncbi:MAG: hypothetical protein KDB14_28665 [Planctomycetales bacterium]|nr:hypothetical protein [Planctomycetales bacterium]
MKVITYLKQLYLAHLSKPVGDRTIYQAIRRHRPRRIVVLGVGDGERVARILHLAAQLNDAKLQFTGQDLFEGRGSEGGGMKLKDAHRRFATDRVNSRLAPGDVQSVLSRMANSLTDTDLMVVTNEHAEVALEAAWYYVPRMLHEQSVVLCQLPGAADAAFEVVTRKEVEARAARCHQPRRAAA